MPRSRWEEETGKGDGIDDGIVDRLQPAVDEVGIEDTDVEGGVMRDEDAVFKHAANSRQNLLECRGAEQIGGVDVVDS